ncbi:glycoside hydrolase family 27 protein [Peristeroidobacter soli]|uniref:glycoside hydrolase family 27 protein n=1 Tax=Peristeroidobacter soli TaxID=2497877 RepID=UPI00101E1F9A|nr:glycoside hydrolase family 27 protein [Peristeroidobacter soli]
MLRAIVSMVLMTGALVSSASERRSPVGGAWVFDNAPPYPGVTMLEVTTRGGRTTGNVTTAWYGPMVMQNVKVEGDQVSFDLRNLNDKANATRRWTARLSGDRVSLVGDMWYAHVEQAGRRASADDVTARRFKFTELPALGTIAPDGQAKAPPMGWSSWNKFAEHIDDATVRAMADYLASSGLRDAGYIHVNIDDGWQGRRDSSGVLQPNEKFPDMKALADYVHSRGLKLGIYSSPGPRTCAGYQGSYGHVAQDARTFAAWGIDYLKYDLCSGEWFYSDADTVKRTYYEMGAALQATGRPVIYSLCEYGRFDVGEWGRSVGGHLWRTTGDITDQYSSMAAIGFEKNGNAAHAGPGGWNDPDMLEVGNGGMSDDEYRTHMTLWAMSAAPLLMGHDLRQTSPAMLELLTNREVIAVDQDARGVQGRAVYKDGATEIWAKPLRDGSVAIALFNRSESAAQMSFAPADAGLASLQSIRNLWQATELKVGETRFTVPAHGAVMLRVRGQPLSRNL